MKLNTYGLKMAGIKAAAGETKGIDPYSGEYIQISYDLDDGRVYADYHISINSWTQYHDPRVITACNAREPMTMQAIAEAIARRVAEHEAETGV